MIGRYTLMWVGLAAGVAAGLFQVKYEVQALEGRLDRINRAILADQQAIHVLKAEWSLLNQPVELGKRALGNLDLKPVAAAQIGSVADLPPRGTGEMLASAPMAAPPSQAATLKGPVPAIAKAPAASGAVRQPAAQSPIAQLPVAQQPAAPVSAPLANPMLASVKQRQ
ncbi:MAG: hypothetical protein IT563_18790 [Alphaproteobacteria bacterium]|nr:hypothetical protein [Alphaproteobacteria bacterium]